MFPRSSPRVWVPHMLTILKISENQFIPVSEVEGSCWINVINPDNRELEKLAVEFGVPSDFLTDPLDLDERARIETEDGVTLIVLRIPKLDENNPEVPFTTVPIGIILTNNTIITVCSADVTTGLELFNGKMKNVSFKNKSRFVLHIFLKSAMLYLKYLKEINKRTNTVEKELQKSLKNEELIKLLNIEKSLVFFTTSLRSNELLMERLQKNDILRLDADEKDMLEDVLIDNKQAIEMTNIYSNILSGMMDAFASVISNNLNIVMKVLTIITIILMIPTLISSIYGMNIGLPFQHSFYAFFIVIGLSIALAAISVLIFMKNKWF
jgi:magnesium transporter